MLLSRYANSRPVQPQRFGRERSPTDYEAYVNNLKVFALVVFCLCAAIPACANIFGTVQGVVHDPHHRPVASVPVVLKSASSDLTASTITDAEGSFKFNAVTLGEYGIAVDQPGFEPMHQSITVNSGSSPVLHLELRVATVNTTTRVDANLDSANVDSVTPTSMVNRNEIANTPGADRTNSLQMITDYVPGAYSTHDMLHIRGGHQVSWLIDGVPIPNTNIASNLGPQIDPKDIDYLEVQRGSYGADEGDRTYGEFNVVPRTGFERNNEGELVMSLGSFYQTNDQANFGSHTERLAYFGSVNANRSNYGLATPIPQVRHDAQNGYGGFGSMIYNARPTDQLRLVGQLRADYYQIPIDPDPNSTGNQDYNTSGLRDGQHENDAFTDLSWVHTFNPDLLLTVSPFYHYNRANYEGAPNDLPAATRSDRTSHYGGLQAAVNWSVARNTIQAGVYGFGQRDQEVFGTIFNDGSAANFLHRESSTGGIAEEFVEDKIKVTPWLTLTAGLRQSHFSGNLSEDVTTPRLGAALQLPRLHWVLRGFYGRFYQAPPLLTASGPLLQYVTDQNLALIPLRGERDEEHQFGITIPYRGWTLDADTFRTRAKNFLDHNNVGESSIFFPVTIDGALVRAWELTLRSPQLWNRGQLHLAYSNQIAEARGAVTGGLICSPPDSDACASSFDYSPVDHDQRNTLSVGANARLPWHVLGSTNVSYGSGFVNGNPNAQYPGDYLPSHSSVDLSLAKSLSDRVSLSVSVLNVTNHRVLLDNSLTFGGFHYNDPREIYGEVRYRFHY